MAQRIMAGRGGRPTSQTRRRTPRPYVLRGLLFCAASERRMSSHWVNNAACYRCRFPEEYALANKVCHPLNVYVREDRVVPRLDRWLAGVFEPAHIERTLDQLASAQQPRSRDAELAAGLRRELAETDRKLARYRVAIEAGADPVIVAGWMRDVQAARAEAEIRLKRLGSAPVQKLDRDQVAAMIRDLGDMVSVLGDVEPARKAKIYATLGLRLTYQPRARSWSVRHPAREI